MRSGLIIFFTTLITGCIGIDYLEDPVISERLEVQVEQIVLKSGEMQMLEAVSITNMECWKKPV